MFAKSGYQVVALSRTPAKRNDCLEMGASDFVVHTDETDRARYLNKLDAIICTIPVPHDVNLFFSLVKPGGGIIHILGNFMEFPGLNGKSSFFHRKQLTGSNIAGVADTQEMINWCLENSIIPRVQVIKPNQINEVWKRLRNSTINEMVMSRPEHKKLGQYGGSEGLAYRYVIDMR